MVVLYVKCWFAFQAQYGLKSYCDSNKCPFLLVYLHLFFQVKPALPVLQQLLYLNDEEVLTDACWALSYLSDGPNDKIQAVIEAGVCQRLVELLL